MPRSEVWRIKRELRGPSSSRRPGAGSAQSWIDRGASAAELGWTDEILDPDVLTIGFARRVPTYKRLTLMLRDPDRLKKLLLDPERPIQLVIAGKSHPADDTGKQLIQQMVQFADDPEIRHRIVFLPNYDIAMALHLYPGCDVWLNNPLRPFEACGTSGMKAALNGALNLSILDGWWDEWFDGNNGWAIPTADGVEDPDRRDDLEATALYDLIENQVRTKFYDVDGAGLPQNWLSMVLHTVTTLGPKVRAAPHGSRLHRAALCAGCPGGLGDRGRRLRRGQGAGGVQGEGRAGAGRTSTSTTSSPRASATAPRSGRRSTSPPMSRSATLDPGDVEVQLVHGKTNHHGDELHDVATQPLELAESYEHGRHQFFGSLELQTLRRVRLHGPGPAQAALPRRAERARPRRERLTVPTADGPPAETA